MPLTTDASPIAIMYLKFDLTGVSSPVTAATLTLTCTDPFCRRAEYALRQHLYKDWVGDDHIVEQAPELIPGCVIGIAASTGGPAALAKILRGLPAGFPIPLLLVQHIASGFEAGFVHWLSGETSLSVNDLIYPLFVTHGTGVKTEISSMPGVFNLSPDMLAEEIQSIVELDIPAVLLFGIPATKDPIGLENFSEDGIVQQATRMIKKYNPEMVVIGGPLGCIQLNPQFF